MGRRIRVLQFAEVVNRHDFIDVIVRHADARRFHVGVCVGPSPPNIADPSYDAETPFWRIGALSRRNPFAAVPALVRILRGWDVDILHAHHYTPALSGALATSIFRRTRLVIGRHYADAIHVLPSAFRRKALLAAEQWANRRAARLAVPSSQILQILLRRQGIARGKIDLIPYGFDPRKFGDIPAGETGRLRLQLGLEGRFSIGTFGRLHKEKGHRFLLEALTLLRPRSPQVALVIAGDGPERSAIEERIRESGLGEAVRMAGWRKDALRIMAAVDAVVQPTLHEAFSQVMIEALWMSRPLVISDVSGATDVISDGENGLIVPAGDAQALAGAVERLALDATLRMRLGAAGRAFVEANLTADRIIPLYEACYLRALEPPPG